jgi:pyrophosphate--fructose-6-phosphate 1-phosphotransferase
LRLGVVFSGGQAPGGHNVVTGLFDALKQLHPDSQLFGFLDGPKGMIDGKTRELTAPILAPYRNQGGFDLLGSGRTKIETEEQRQAVLKTAQTLKLNGIVIIGGDDSNTNAALLSEFFAREGTSICVIGVPKTIDGDLQNEEVAISFGFDTATRTYATLISNIARDALSAKKYTHFIRLMGRSASHIALQCALLTQPNLTLISEERRSLPEIVGTIADLVEERAASGKNYGVILLPEGLIEFLPEIPPELKAQCAEVDAHGNPNLSAVETERFLIECVRKELSRRAFQGKFQGIPHFFGYEGRAAIPTPFDADYCYALGFAAALLSAHRHSGYMAFVRDLKENPTSWTIGGIPLLPLMRVERRQGVDMPVIAKSLVRLEGPQYRQFQSLAPQWRLQEAYRICAPVQFR